MSDFEDARYWKAKDPHRVITAMLKSVQERQTSRRTRDAVHLMMYGIAGAEALISPQLRAVIARPSFLEAKPKLQLNIVRSVIDTATALIGGVRPRAQFMTDGGKWDEQTRAKNRGRFVEAVIAENDGYTLGHKSFRNAGIFGTGLLKVCREYGKIVLEATPISEVFVDEYEGLYGKPCSYFHQRHVDKLRLIEMFPQHRNEIEKSEPTDSRWNGRGTIADQTQVTETWHMPSGPEADDGWKFTTIGEATLARQPWRWQHPPFAVFRFNDPTFGWYGEGIVQEIRSQQEELNSLLRTAQANFHMASGLKVFVDKGSGISPGQIGNSLKGQVMEVNMSSHAPVFYAPDPIPASLLPMILFHIEQMYGVVGISVMGSRGEIPAGLSGSGRSMLVYQNVESKRFQVVQQRYEQFFMDLSERILEAAADEYEENGEMLATYIGDRWTEQIDFAEIQGDCYKIIPYPTSIMPQTPAGKLAMVEQLQAMQLIDEKQGRKLLDFPDLKSELDLDLAPIELIDERLQHMVKTGEYLPPHPRMDIELAFKRSTLAYQRGEIEGMPDDALDMIGQFIDDCQALIELAASPAASPPGAPVGPEAAPMGPDVSTVPATVPGELPPAPAQPAMGAPAMA